MIKKIAKITGIVLASLVGLIVLFVGLVFLILTPARLTPLVNEVASDYLDAKVTFDTVDLTLLEDFPLVSIRLKNATVISEVFSKSGVDSTSASRSLAMRDSASVTPSMSAYDPKFDTLVRFEELMVSGNILEILTGNFAIRRVRLTSPVINGYVAADGRASWDIYKFSNDTTADQESSHVRFDVNRITLRRTARLSYCNMVDSMAADISFRRFSVRGRFTDNIELCELKRLTLSDLELSAELGVGGDAAMGARVHARIDTLGIRQVDSLGRHQYTLDFRSNYSAAVNGMTYCDSLPLNIRGGFGLDPAWPMSVAALTLRDMTLQLDMIRIAAAGRLEMHGDSIVESNLAVSVDSISLGRLIELVPPDLAPRLKGFHTNLVTSINADVRGSYNVRDAGVLPRIRMDVRSNEGRVSYGSNARKLDKVAFDLGLFFTPGVGDSTGVVVRRLDVAGAGLELNVKPGTSVWNALVDPHFKGEIKGAANLDVLGELFPSSRGIAAHGMLGVDLKADVCQSQLSLSKIGGADIRARITMDSVVVDSPVDSLRLMVMGGRITVGANENKRDSLMDRGARVLRASIGVDSAHVEYGGMMANLSKVRIRVRNAASSLSSADRRIIHPLTGSFQGKRIYLRDLDSAFVRVVDGKGDFSILPSTEDNTVPLIKVHLQSKTVVLRDKAERIRIAQADINFAATISVSERARAIKRQARLDSLQHVYPGVVRDSLSRHDRRARMARRANNTKSDFADQDLDLKVEGKLAQIIRRWRLSGSIKAKRIRLVSAYFPLRNTLNKVDIDFTNRELNIRNTVIRSGSSEFKVTGSISNIQNALLRGGILSAQMDIKSDTLNVNELVRAANAGVAYSNMVSSGELQGLQNIEDDDQLQRALESTIAGSNQSNLVVIPANLNVDLGFTVNYGIYANLGIDSLSGSVRVRDRVMEIKDLYTKTDAGEISMTAIYATRSKSDITAGFDIDMRNMQVNRLIELIPAIDSITPMLRSFEGQLNCQIAATSAIDTAMNLILPTLSAAVRISGKDMVLMDGQTFAEISKMLHFKNKKRNYVEKISVEMLVRDNHIEMFPFIMEIDRYQTAISGIHNLDMSFKYHISVLKSPIPFRMGVNVFGNLDDFNFSIGKALYKSASIPTYMALVDTVRINLREQIAEISSRGIRAASLGQLSAVSNVKVPTDSMPSFEMEALTAADSLQMRQAGLLDSTVFISLDATAVSDKKPIKKPIKKSGRRSR